MSDWIPYDGQHPVPDTDRKVLISLKWSEDDYEVTYGEYFAIENSEKKKRFGYWDKYVTAWMDYPEPYKI